MSYIRIAVIARPAFLHSAGRGNLLVRQEIASREDNSGKIIQLHYALFSRSGFTPALETRAQQEGVALYGMSEIVRAE